MDKRLWITFATFLFFTTSAFALKENVSPGDLRHPDAGLSIIQLVKKHGYPLERHKNIQTSDGYILELHRIPHGRSNVTSTNRPVVLVMHGILSSSVDWVNMGPEKGLGYLLAEAGYDVWMGNSRGNTWSRRHVKLNPNKDSEFWDFSWHEIGFYDLPAMIDYIIDYTGQQKISYLAHSQGSAAFWVMASEKPKYNKFIKFSGALAPIAFMTNVPSTFLRMIGKFEKSISWITSFLGVNEFLPKNKFMAAFAKGYCKDGDVLQMICKNILFIIAGLDTQLNRTMIPVALSNTPAGSSTKQFLHFAQLMKTESFRQYDHGTFENLIKYGSLIPPSYNLSKITTPVGLFYGQHDIISSIKDVRILTKKLPNLVYNFKVRDKNFGHLDFLWAMDAPRLLYNRVIKVMDKYR